MHLLNDRDFLESLFGEEYLKHFGIPGMKWGRRKARSTMKSVKKKLRSPKKNQSDDYKKTTTLRKKKIHQLSNAELKVINERLQLERSYKDLSSKDVSPGRKFAQDLLKDVGRETIRDVLKEGIKIGIKAVRKR